MYASGSSSVLPLGPYSYATVSGARLHDLLHTRLSTSPSFALVTGSVESVRDAGDLAIVTLDGKDLRARWAFDSRPLVPVPSGPRLVFLGWEIETDADVFDARVATFMDFRGRRPGCGSFCYLLPTTTRHALVEIAQFQWTNAAPDLAGPLAGPLADYLRQVRGVDSWTVTRTEGGSLPLARPPADGMRGAVVPIGVRAGMLKPSTGFALERIQRHSAGITASLNHYDHPHGLGRRRRRRHAWLDSIFLEVLRRDPDIIEDVMARLFTRNYAPAVLRFLDEDSTALQEASLVATLPISPFLRAVLLHRRPAESHREQGARRGGREPRHPAA